MSKKNRNHESNVAVLEAPETAAIEEAPNNPLESMTREDMIAHMQSVDSGMDFSGLSDDDLRSFVAETMGGAEVQSIRAEAPVEEEPVAGEETPAEVLDDPTKVEIAGVILKDATKEELIRVVDTLRSEIEVYQKGAGTKRKIASGSKARPNVVYTLLEKPPKWDNTPQVAQIQQILFDPKVAAEHTVEVDGKKVVQMTEPEVFALIEQGKKNGVLRTRQEPVRIFQYYRSNLLNTNCLRWA